MDQAIQDALTRNIQEVRTSLVTFQEETRENFRKVDDQFAQVRDEMRRMEQNNLALFSLLFAHLSIDVPPDLLK